jgi:hypothetical protein
MHNLVSSAKATLELGPWLLYFHTSSFAKNSVLLWVTKILFQAGQATNVCSPTAWINRTLKIDFGTGFAHPRRGKEDVTLCETKT